jgi:23S rRNA (cytidine1920-2'-O)/16S rRNA (cytidine1409-2'-O)-methyltransferase
VNLVTADVSFISLDLILPAAVRWLQSDGQVVALIKPQFEAGRREVGKGGVVRDPQVHRTVLERVLDGAMDLGLGLRGLMTSPLRGPAGNVEFLGWWWLGAPALEVAAAVDACLGVVQE